jgi:hypothetical protein
MPPPSLQSRDSSTVVSDDDSVNERTWLLPRPSGRATSCDAYAAKSAEVSQTYGLWQVGALLGILLAFADTSLVWATHETIASHFDSLQNASWMMTSFTIGYFVTLPMVSCPTLRLACSICLWVCLLTMVSQYRRLCDNLGSIRTLLVAYSTFCVGSTLWYVLHNIRPEPCSRCPG